MAKIFGVDEKELLTVWLADKVLDIVENEDDVKSDAIRYVQKVIKSGKWWQVGAMKNLNMVLQNPGTPREHTDVYLNVFIDVHQLLKKF